MSMSVGPAKVALVEFEYGSVHCHAYPHRLAMVLDILNNGAIGRTDPKSTGGYGSPGHLAALLEVEKQIDFVRKSIAESEAKDRERED